MSGGGLSLKTLAIAGAASATAAFLVPMIWQPGTVFAAAMTPIIVTVMTELLRRPAEHGQRGREAHDGDAVAASRAASSPSRSRTRSSTRSRRRRRRTSPTCARGRPERTVHPPRRKLTSRQWRLALATGVLAFVCAVDLRHRLAAPRRQEHRRRQRQLDHVLQRQLAARPRPRRGEQTPTPTKTPEDDATRTPTPTPTPSATPTPTPTPTATPAPSVAPQAAPPVPSPTPAP